MDPNVLGVVARILLLMSLCSGLFALVRAADKGFWAAAVAIFAGMLIGLAGLACSLHTEHLFIDAERARGGPIHSDMPGFGVFMFGALGLLYFACVSLGAAIIAMVRRYRR